MDTILEFTVPEKILLAAHQLEETGQSPFSAEALIVAVWQQNPRTFGLKGYAEQYPDSNKVLTSLMGEKGLARRGWLNKVGQKMYALTREGRHMVRRLRHEEPAPSAPATENVTIGREQDKLLQGLFGSTALRKYQEGQKHELTFADACRFWSITENMSGPALDARLHAFRAGLADIERTVRKGQAVLSDGRVFTFDDASLLNDLHLYLEDRFSRHLTLLRNRSGKS
ncbi:MAG TPA: hypothetical protein VMS17_00135 [Gemmataceae bacterium]|nr:hypothetical protein [Gemmataceae bacterium]